MIRLTLEKFDYKADERGNLQETNRIQVINVIVETLTPGWQKQLLDLLNVAVSPVQP